MILKMIAAARRHWLLLNQSIYIGDKYEKNIAAIRWFGLICAAFGTGMSVMNILQHKGFAILWTMLMPLAICYFVGVKQGILLSFYFEILIVVLFYTPLRSHFIGIYTVTFMNRFPIVYLCGLMITAVSMTQYHESVLTEIEYTERLNAEVKKQTKVAVEQSRVATERANQLERLSKEMVETLARAIDAKDRYTNGHSFRVSEYAVKLARRLGWEEKEVADLQREALLHDIGKIGVPDAVLNKPGRLTDVEFETIKSHTT